MSFQHTEWRGRGLKLASHVTLGWMHRWYTVEWMLRLLEYGTYGMVYSYTTRKLGGVWEVGILYWLYSSQVHSPFTEEFSFFWNFTSLVVINFCYKLKRTFSTLAFVHHYEVLTYSSAGFESAKKKKTLACHKTQIFNHKILSVMMFWTIIWIFLTSAVTLSVQTDWTPSDGDRSPQPNLRENLNY